MFSFVIEKTGDAKASPVFLCKGYEKDIFGIDYGT